MEVELVNKEKDSIVVKVIGEDHTLCNVVRKSLYEDENVVAAAYRIEHPLLTHPEFQVKVKKDKPERALIDAAERVAERCVELQKELQKALKSR